MIDVDLVNRDPNRINAHLGTLFYDDILGEPDGIHSIDCVWKLAVRCFEGWKKICYYLLTTFCGICIAMEWGCQYGYIAFAHIWFITPCMKILEMNCGICQRIYATCLNCCLVPMCEACGSIFHNFKK